jgi:hypothetical protein
LTIPRRAGSFPPVFRFDVDEDDVLVATLEYIAAMPCDGEERLSRAQVAVKDCITCLYGRLGIAAANRLPVSVKSSADQSLTELRRGILAAEIRIASSDRMVFTAARHRIEMARRVLASRVVKDDGAGAEPAGRGQQPRGSALGAALTRQDRILITAIRKRLGNREQIVRSNAAIEESRSLLEIAGREFRLKPPLPAFTACAEPAWAA